MEDLTKNAQLNGDPRPIKYRKSQQQALRVVFNALKTQCLHTTRCAHNNNFLLRSRCRHGPSAPQRTKDRRQSDGKQKAIAKAMGFQAAEERRILFSAKKFQSKENTEKFSQKQQPHHHPLLSQSILAHFVL